MTDPMPKQPDDELVVHADVELLELRRRIDTLEEESSALRRFGILALVVAALACGGAFSAHSGAVSAGRDVERLGAELSAAKEDIKRTQQGPIPTRFLPREITTDEADDPEASTPRPDAELRRRLELLEQRVGNAPAQANEVEAGLVAWGAETKRYVDEATTRTGDEQRRLRDEVTRIWERLLDVEARLDGR